MNHFKHMIGKLMSGSPWKQLGVASVLFVLAFGLVALITWAIEHTLCINYIPARMLSPIPLREALEGTDGGNPWAVSIAYIFGLIVFSGVLIATITNIIRTIGDRYLNGTAYYRFKNHILFLGYDELMIGTLKQILTRMGEHDDIRDVVIAVPEDVAEIRKKIYQKLSNEQTKRVYVIYASRTRIDDLQKRVGVEKAESIYIIGQPEEVNHDTDNLRCLSLVAYLCRKKTGHTTYCMYYLQNQATLYLMHRLEYNLEDFSQYLPMELRRDTKGVKEFVKKSEPFNFYESISRHVLIGDLEKGKFLAVHMSGRDPHFVIFGITEMGYALIRNVLMTQHFPDKTLHVTLIDPQASMKMHQLTLRHRPLFDNCQYSLLALENPSLNLFHEAKLDFLDVVVDFIQCDYGNAALAEKMSMWAENDSLAIAVCTDSTSDNMELALHMPLRVQESKAPVWAYQSDDSSMNTFLRQTSAVGLNGVYKNIHLFSSEGYGTQDRRLSKEWALAEKVSDKYEEEKVKNNHGESIIPWCDQQPKNRWSSLYGAISKIVMLRAMGYSGKLPENISEEIIDKIAKAEHNRWCTEKLLNGWWPSSSTKNNEYHKCIVSNEELARRDEGKRPNEEKDAKKDIDQVERVIESLGQMNL